MTKQFSLLLSVQLSVMLAAGRLRSSTTCSFWGVFAWLDLLLAFGFAGLLFTRFWTSRNWRDAVHERRFELLLVGLCAALLVLTPALPDKLLADVFPGLPYRSALDKFLGVVQLFLLGNICIQLVRLLQRIFVAGVRAEVVLAGSFAALVLVGTLLLLLPAVSEDPTIPIGPMDAFFTSVSASCVTGLSVRDTGTAFSNFGQLIILVLIQVGGLGIVTFVAFISVFSAKTLPVPQMVAFRRMISASGTDDLKARLAGIILLTAIIEGSEPLLLCYDGRRYDGETEVERVSLDLRLLQCGIRSSVQQSRIVVEQPRP